MKTEGTAESSVLTRRAWLGLIAGAAAGPFVLRRRSAWALPDPAVVGSWGPRVKMPHIAIHLASLPGYAKVLMASSKQGSIGTKAWTYDPTTHIIEDVSLPFPFDFMCGGGIVSEAGNPQFYGGLNGCDRSFRFTASNIGTGTPVWKELKRHTIGRYYPNTVEVGESANWPAGAILTAFGKQATIDIYGRHDYDYATRQAKMAATANIANYGYSQQYPRIHLLPSPLGEVVLIGTEQPIKILNVDAQTWTTIGMMSWGRRYEGCATRLPGDGNEFLLTGGDIAATNRRQERFNVLTGAKRETASMNFPRMQANTVLLPNGHVLILGGRAAPTNPNAPELYNPVTETCTTMADTPTHTLINGKLVADKPSYRGYHSTACVLRDGRVIWAGGTDGTKGMSAEIFTPPQIQGLRPTLSILPGMERVLHGGLLTGATPTPNDVDHVALLRHTHVSHGHATPAYYKLPTLVFPDGTVQAQVPAGKNAAPAGWYTAFALTATGVWSPGVDIRIG